MTGSAGFLDANVWLALTVEAHTHHGRAKAYWEAEAAPSVVFCRVTQMALLRLLTNRSVMAAQVLSPAAAWAKCAELLAPPEVRLAAEPVAVEGTWKRHCATSRTSPNLWTDAYLAAFASTAGMRLVTFDKGFSKFDGLDCLFL
jgi:hypothetical protein